LTKIGVPCASAKQDISKHLSANLLLCQHRGATTNNPNKHSPDNHKGMKLKRRHKFTAEVATSSLNDIMFFLLLFFLIIATVANPNVIKILLPKAATSQAFSKRQVALTVTADKLYFINNKQIPYEQLETELLASLKGIDDPTVVLRIDQSLNVQELVTVMGIGSKLKIKMVLATKSST